MALRLFSRYAHNTWQGFALRVAVIAIAAGIVLGLADVLGISLDPMRPAPRYVPPAETAPHPTPGSTEH